MALPKLLLPCPTWAVVKLIKYGTVNILSFTKLLNTDCSEKPNSWYFAINGTNSVAFYTFFGVSRWPSCSRIVVVAEIFTLFNTKLIVEHFRSTHKFSECISFRFLVGCGSCLFLSFSAKHVFCSHIDNDSKTSQAATKRLTVVLCCPTPEFRALILYFVAL